MEPLINSEQTSLTIKRIEWETKWQLIVEIKAEKSEHKTQKSEQLTIRRICVIKREKRTESESESKDGTHAKRSDHTSAPAYLLLPVLNLAFPFALFFERKRIPSETMFPSVFISNK